MAAQDLMPWNMPSSAGHDWVWYNDDPSHDPSLMPTTPPGTILCTDLALYAGPTTTVGFVFAVGSSHGVLDAGQLASDHLDPSLGNGQPSGEQELYNDGSVIWPPLSQIKTHASRASVYFWLVNARATGYRPTGTRRLVAPLPIESN